MADVNEDYYVRFMFRAVLSSTENNGCVIPLLAS